MSKTVRLLVSAVVVYLLVCSAAAVFLAESTVRPYHRPLDAGAVSSVRRLALAERTHVDDVKIHAGDGVSLGGWYIPSQSGNGNAVILLHGLGDNRLGTIGYAEILLKHGFSVLMPDARAHGESGGALMTYGLIERDDIRQWFEWLEANGHTGCIFGFAESMGAAQLLQALDSEPNFCAVAAESSFSNFREIAYDRMGQQFHASAWVGLTLLRPVVEIALAYVQMKYHLDLTKVSPEESVARTRVPVLLIHGTVDSNIPVRHSHRIKAQNASVELWEVPGADHCGAISVAPTELERRLVTWFQAHDRHASASPVVHAF